MNNTREESLSPPLAEAVQAAREVPDAAVDAAQRRLATAMQAQAPRARAVPRRWALAGLSAMAALLLVIVLPLLSGQGNAFAAVQAHFRQFRTLQMVVEQRHGGELRLRSRTRVDATGATRTDIGEDLSIIVDPARGRVLTLLHQPRQAMLAAIPPQAAATGKDLAWLDELRAFNGKATRLPASRQIDGRPVQGWQLQLAGNTTEIWADEDGLPLQMQMHGGGLQIDYRFTFDPLFEANVFDTTVPAGYAPVEADEN